MSGYRELQQAYENNHEVTVFRRNLARDAVNGLRLALLGRLGISNQNSDVVAIKSRDGGDLFSHLARLEIGDALQARGEIAVEGISTAPSTKFMFDLTVSYRQDRIVVEVVGMEAQVINDNVDLHKLADSIFERILLKLSTY
ncbi:hypothetical protein PPUN110474_38860 [Pseudomonas putida]|nr:hypothetical protein PPUN110474_38860 [Pseudomonas putida]